MQQNLFPDDDKIHAPKTSEERSAYKRWHARKQYNDPVRRQRKRDQHESYRQRLQSSPEGRKLIAARRKRFLDSKKNDEIWKEHTRAKHREGYARNIDLRRSKARLHAHKRRVLVKDGGTYAIADIEALLQKQGYRCAACKKVIRHRYEIDHVMPVSLGGANTIDNLQLLCRPCNRRKKNMHPDEWAAKLGRLFI
jgi:5-methylcytosine-specific restriction endonuclease McrA